MTSSFLNAQKTIRLVRDCTEKKHGTTGCCSFSAGCCCCCCCCCCCRGWLRALCSRTPPLDSSRRASCLLCPNMEAVLSAQAASIRPQSGLNLPGCRSTCLQSALIKGRRARLKTDRGTSGADRGQIEDQFVPICSVQVVFKRRV